MKNSHCEFWFEVGRYSPYHLGHQNKTNLMRQKYGSQCASAIGSAEIFLKLHDMYTYTQRKRFIETIHPGHIIDGLNDIPWNDDARIEQLIKTIGKYYKGDIKNVEFFGGNEEDIIRFYDKWFSCTIVDRFDDQQSTVISGTQVRKTILDSYRMQNADFAKTKLQWSIDPRIIDDVVDTYFANMDQLKKNSLELITHLMQ